jgi:hypothetical protein
LLRVGTSYFHSRISPVSVDQRTGTMTG